MKLQKYEIFDRMSLVIARLNTTVLLLSRYLYITRGSFIYFDISFNKLIAEGNP